MTYFAPFVISGIATEEIAKRIGFSNFNLLRDKLNEQIRLSKFGTAVEGIALIFIVLPTDSAIHKEEIAYRPKHKELYVTKKLPYQLIETLDQESILQLMAEAYLEAIEDLPKLKIKDFDYENFHADVEQLFENQGWLVHQEA